MKRLSNADGTLSLLSLALLYGWLVTAKLYVQIDDQWLNPVKRCGSTVLSSIAYMFPSQPNDSELVLLASSRRYPNNDLCWLEVEIFIKPAENPRRMAGDATRV